jgi:hypothetical protein
MEAFVTGQVVKQMEVMLKTASRFLTTISIGQMGPGMMPPVLTVSPITFVKSQLPMTPENPSG